ncbi:MAG: DNA translocase FtsK 4TM domain-containing protein [Bacteroidales bacterium]|nr:DNA translocase FtsK 4TM domain-containing protein [Bacteroidales bacterium]
MAKSKEPKEVKVRRPARIFTFWRDMDEDRKRRIVGFCGLLVAVFALFTLISCISYIFHWKEDMSLLSDPDRMALGESVSNLGGKAGALWSSLLFYRWFGFGSFALVLLLAIVSMRMLGRKSVSMLKALLLTLTGAVISSFILAYVSRTAGMEYAFGGGLGGRMGDYAVQGMSNLMGDIVTAVVLVLLTVLWFFFASRRFSDWFTLAVSPSGKPVPAHVAVDSPIEPAVAEVEPEISLDKEEEEPSKPAGFTWVQSVPEASPATSVTPAPVVAAPEVPAAGEAAEQEPSLEVVEGEELSTEVYEELPRIDIRDELKDYRFPSLDLLDSYESSRSEVSQDELRRNNFKIRGTLKTFKVEVDNVKAVVGPTVTLYKVYPAPGVKISMIKNLQDDIAMSLNAKGVRVVTLEDSVGIEVANDKPSIVPLKALLNDDAFRQSKAELPVAIGYTITQNVKVFDLADAPHLLVAGATKQGKSVGLNVLITSLLYSKHPSELKFVFIDPKMVEFSAYEGLLKHYLAVLPTAGSEQDERDKCIAKTAKDAEAILKSLCVEMDERYALLSKGHVNNIKLYNEKYKDRHLNPNDGHKYMPYIVTVVDEYADLTMSVGGGSESKAIARSISTSIIRLAQKGRAAGIHVVLATQRPSVDVITGLIKSNFPTRIAFRVFSMTDSRTILDSPGAEKLIGKGDMIYLSGVDNERVQCAFISNAEINSINDFIGAQTGWKKSFNTPYYLPAPEPDQAEDGTAMVDMKNLDERFEEAARQVVLTQRGSTSDLQRKLGMGYAKAGRVMDQLEAAGIVGPQDGSKPRQVLVADLAELEGIIEAFKNAQ